MLVGNRFEEASLVVFTINLLVDEAGGSLM
jgi:hypothetical protein